MTAHACEVLQRVPPATEAIHRIGSTEPAAMLFDAMEVGGWWMCVGVCVCVFVSFIY